MCRVVAICDVSTRWHRFELETVRINSLHMLPISRSNSIVPARFHLEEGVSFLASLAIEVRVTILRPSSICARLWRSEGIRPRFALLNRHDGRVIIAEFVLFTLEFRLLLQNLFLGLTRIRNPLTEWFSAWIRSHCSELWSVLSCVDTL